MTLTFDLQFDSKQCRTHVHVQSGALTSVGDLLHANVPSSQSGLIVLVTDKTVGALYGQTVKDSLERSGLRLHEAWIEPGESSKTVSTLQHLYRVLRNCYADRGSVILALGGGVVSDLTGFLAATWMRGVRFAICPTTLEADVDASIGGKTAINLSDGKNLVGAFHHPSLVIVDPLCLKSLLRRDIAAGLAESVKHALIASPEFFAWHEKYLEAVLVLDAAATTELIGGNIRIKSDVVMRDPYEHGGGRILLNFGHTIGHAIESCCGYALRHGECVSLGMVAACRISSELGLFDTARTIRVEQLLQRIGLPIMLEQAIETERIMETIKHDKKSRGGKIPFVLLEAIGRPVVRDDVPTSLIRQAFESLQSPATPSS